MLNYWDKLVYDIENRANQIKDQDTKNWINKIKTVPIEIKTWVLKLYVWKCRNLHQIAFF